MTIKEIAQLAGVSISTVSKIMNHKDESISTETRERVLRIAKEYHYTPYSNAAASTGKTFLLGVLIRSCASARILEGILNAARAHGYTILLEESSGLMENEYKAIASFCKNRVDGILWEPVCGRSMDYAEQLDSVGIPYLTFCTSPSKEIPDFQVDYEKLGYSAASLLVHARHQKIACLLSFDENTAGFSDGYKKCLFDSCISLQDALIYPEVCDNLLQKIASHTITGVICACFSSALRLYEELNRLCIHIPDDVSIVSLREEEQANISYPRISSVMIPGFAFGRHLCQNLIGILEQEQEIIPFEMNPLPDHTETIYIPYGQQAPGITVVGSIHIDHFLKVNELPVSGITSVTTGLTFYPGGKGVNQAIGAARLGARVSLIGSVGDDADANLIFSVLTEHSIDSCRVYRHVGCSTGQAHVFVQSDGNSTISILSGANNSLSPEDILRSERVFENTGYCLLQTELPQDTLIQACILAHAHGAKNILKPAACAVLNEKLLRLVDFLVPNQHEADILCPGKSLPEQADYFLSYGLNAVIVTLGEKGCYLKTSDCEKYFPAADFTAFDSTGAGDAFICAFAVYLQKGYSIQKAIRIAAYAAGFSVTREGVVPSLIDKNTLEAHIMRTEPDLLKF